MKKALISGITGQDGSYLAELLLSKGYEVHGIVRSASSMNRGRIDHLTGIKLHYGDLYDEASLFSVVAEVQPDEVYNLGAQSHVRVSFDNPISTVDSIAMGTLRLLEAIRKMKRPARFYQASSSEMFGEVRESPQTETTPFNPQSPYACAKVFAHYQTQNYRKAYGLHASCGILFNHESPRRGETFVTRKITQAAVRISHGSDETLYLGNLDAMRDWGFAGDYVEAMWLMLQQDKPDDYVIATGETHSVREFLDEAFGLLNLDWVRYVKTDPKFYRPSEVNLLLGYATKAKKALGWKPKVYFKELVRNMIGGDLREYERKLQCE